MARILIIDDDPSCREMLKFRFRKEGYEVEEAADGDDGLMKALRQPDVVLLDIRIPKMDGWELCKTLKSDPITKHIPIIMLTGCSQPLQMELGKTLGADEYIIKPWDPDHLMDVTKKILARKKP